MADQESHSSRAEQRMLAVAKLKRAASLPRMKDGRRPPMHVEAVSEGEKAQQSEEEKAASEEERGGAEPVPPSSEEQKTQQPLEQNGKTLEPEPDNDQSAPPPPQAKSAEVEAELDTELEERPMSPSAVFKKRRRSRSRSRGSKDLKGKARAPQSPVPQLGDSSQDENPPLPSPLIRPMGPPLLSPTPHFPFLQQSRFLRSPTPVSPEMSLFYPGTSPPTPLPTLEDLQKGLMRSNSAGASAVGRRMAMHKLTGGTETYDPSPSPTPPPHLSKLTRNNTVSGGERIAARQNMLSRLGTRITKEADAELASGTEDRGAPSPTPKRRRRRSRRTSATVNPNPFTSDSDFNSTNPDTPAIESTTLPSLQDHYAELRAQSVTPNQLSSSRTQSSEHMFKTTLSIPVPVITPPAEEEPERPEQTRRRSVLIEDPDEEDRDAPQQLYPNLPGTPQHAFHALEGLRAHHSSDAPSSGSDSGPSSAVGVPVFFSQRAPSRNEMFPSSPFTTPIKEKTLSDEDEEEQVLYPASTIRPRTPYSNLVENYDREISWVASPVPEIRMPVDDDEDEEELEHEIEVEVEPEYEEGKPFSLNSSNGFSPEVYDDISPRASSSKSVFVESETTSPEVTQSYAPASPSSATPLSLPPSVDGSVSPPLVATRSSIASRIQSIGDRSPLTAEFSDLEDRYLGADSPKRAETTSTSTWEKVKSTFSRSGSTSGRRSRSNSIITRERRDQTDSSVSRESGASLTSSKTDKAEYAGIPGQAPLMQSPSASTSILSLAPHAPPRGSVSPIPPPSSADMSRYQNSKLFPFPGMLRLEEERRAKGYPSANASSPDVSLQAYAQGNIQAPSIGYSFSNTPTPDLNKERKLSPKTSEAHLDAKYTQDSATTSPSSPYYPEYLDISPSAINGSSYNLKLPTTLPGVRQWLGKNSKKKPSSPAAGAVSFSPLPVVDAPTIPSTDKKPSLSDLFNKKANDLNHEWDRIDQKQTSPAGNGVGANGVSQPDEPEVHVIDVQTSDVQRLGPLDLAAGRGSPFKFPPEMSPARFATPDPSSISDYPAPTASESSSTSSSRYSLRDHQGSVVLEKLEENLARGWSPMWASAIDDPPRKLVLSSPVLQVVNPNTVKDRFLFLFNDILVITKPVAQDHDQLMDTYKLSLPDRKYAVKSVVQLRTLRFCADRSEVQTKTQSVGPRNPLMRSFISQFSKDPDHAIAFLFMKSNVEEDPGLLGQLLFKTLELDRSRLGEYLSRKSSKAVLKSYLDSFGFAGLRVDVALRVFLHSINVSRHPQSHGALEYLLDSFASRWYEANAKFVAYDKDMAIRLVWALAQLNDRLHGGIADEPGPTDHAKRNVTNREFQDAFRRYDVRFLVSEEMLQELYRSIFRERLCQAYFRIMDVTHDTPITIKRPLPSRLTYKAQSEPIVFRLPQADPLLTIELYGQDMTFDPPVLQFVRSAEASFRIMGTSLGSKTVTMCRSGPNAIKYSGLPLSHTIVVERAFMRNTFQLAFLNQAGAKRKYMFSVDDPIIRNEWATSLRRHIDSAKITASTPGGSASHTASKFHKAAEAVAFKVLQDTLMGSSTSGRNHRTNGSHSIQASHNGTNPYLTGSTPSFTSPLHIRSKSRSKVYHRHGAGKNELDLGHRSLNGSQESNDSSPESSDKALTPEDRLDGALWTIRDLEMQCQQNSSISLVLSFLQVAAPDSPS